MTSIRFEGTLSARPSVEGRAPLAVRAAVAGSGTNYAAPSEKGLHMQTLRGSQVAPPWRPLSQSKTGVSTPSTLCSFGLVVVYCRWMRLSGKM